MRILKKLILSGRRISAAMRIALFIPILLAALVLTTGTTRSADLERDALIALYDSTQGDGWKNNTGWKTGAPHCSWYGVTCDLNDTVVSLHLNDNQLNGPIPPELGDLSGLVVLALYGNQLNGSIPPELGGLSQLTSLSLWGNQLSGPIPPELGSLSSLVVLDLDDNQLSGSIPPELGSLSGLVVLALYGNQLNGAIPPELGSLPDLEGLYLNDNRLGGAIPSELSSLSNLEWLFLDGNPALVCWETAAGRDWALSLGAGYSGPTLDCNSVVRLIHLPVVLR